MSQLSLSLYYARLSLLITSITRNTFSLAFGEATLSLDDSQTDLSAEELLSRFNSISANVLDSVAPLKTQVRALDRQNHTLAEAIFFLNFFFCQ